MKRSKVFQKKKLGNRTFNPRKNRDELYDGKWQRYSRLFLHHNPKCYVCGENSKVVDHLRPHRGDLKLFWMQENFIPMCARCHNVVTAKFDRDVTKKLEEKLTWMAEKRKLNGVMSAVVVVPLPL